MNFSLNYYSGKELCCDLRWLSCTRVKLQSRLSSGALGCRVCCAFLVAVDDESARARVRRVLEAHIMREQPMANS